MSPSSSRRRPRRPPRPPRGRNRPPQHAATSALVSSILLVTTVWLTASATYYAVQFFEQMRVEQRAAVADFSATGTIKQERITPPEATPDKMPTPASPTNDTVTFIAPPSPELRPGATTKRHQIHRAALRQPVSVTRITPPEATLAKMPTPASPTNDTVTFVAPPSPELRPSATTKRHQIHRAAHSRRHSVGAPPSAAAGIAPP
jgi:hypothetical protein